MIEPFELVAKASADGSRVRILKLLEQGELCVCQITGVLDLAPATVSKHLSILKAAGLVFQRKAGKWVYCRLADHPVNPFALPMLDLIKQVDGDAPRMSEDRQRLAAVIRIPLAVLCSEGSAAIDRLCAPEQGAGCC